MSLGSSAWRRRAAPLFIFAVVAGCSAIVSGPATRPASQPASASVQSRDVRPLLGEAQYEALARELREKYAGPSDRWPQPTLDPGVLHRELGLIPTVEHPADNPFSPAKQELGRTLFFDPRLSGSGSIACASCHDPDLGWADGRTVAFGHGRAAGKRNTPTIMNSGFNVHQFWDGRADSLEEQAKRPVAAEDEMNADPAVVVARLAEAPEYRRMFREAFGDERIDMDRVAMASATFERTVVGGRSRFDAFLKGNRDALNDAAIRGLHLFRTDARCLNCHNGPTFTDHGFHDLGLSYYGRPFEDLGRYHVTKKPQDVGKFKTPSLRNVGRTAPYMHNGLFELDGVLSMYNAGMPTLRRKEGQENDPLFPTKSALLKPLRLNERDLADLKEFLLSLNEPTTRVRPPKLPAAATAPSTRNGE